MDRVSRMNCLPAALGDLTLPWHFEDQKLKGVVFSNQRTSILWSARYGKPWAQKHHGKHTCCDPATKRMLLTARSAKMVRATNICGDKQAECFFEMLHCYMLEEVHPPQHSNPQLKPISPTLKRQASSRKIPQAVVP